MTVPDQPASVRLASDADAAALQAIYGHYVLNTVISFELEPPSAAEMAGRMRQAAVWLVAEAAPGQVLGYAYAGKHRDRAAYQWSVDVTVYLDPAFHRRGIGRGLYTALFGLLRLQGYVNAYAGITQPNAASVGLHTALGFEPIGLYRGVGYKFGQWHDVAWLGLAGPGPPAARQRARAAPAARRPPKHRRRPSRTRRRRGPDPPLSGPLALVCERCER
jgi:L-amino acid N-acyltransferase YncA